MTTVPDTALDTAELDIAANQAEPLDALLVDAALGPLRRHTPDLSTVRFVRRLARHPATTPRRLAGLARELGAAYTRYADDLTFSGDDASAVGGLRALATRIIRE
ncbi:MAG TPA: hypothetical protein VF892_08795, partial [Pseudonocardiaceae bacterium]